MNTDRELMQQALENCRLLAAKHRKEEWAQHILRFCEEAGVRPTALRERLALDEERQYDADHVVLEKGTNDCVCTHCGQRYHIHMPVPMSIMTAIVDAFLEAHHHCEKPEAA